MTIRSRFSFLIADLSFKDSKSLDDVEPLVQVVYLFRESSVVLCEPPVHLTKFCFYRVNPCIDRFELSLHFSPQRFELALHFSELSLHFSPQRFELALDLAELRKEYPLNPARNLFYDHLFLMPGHTRGPIFRLRPSLEPELFPLKLGWLKTSDWSRGLDETSGGKDGLRNSRQPCTQYRNPTRREFCVALYFLYIVGPYKSALQ